MVNCMFEGTVDIFRSFCDKGLKTPKSELLIVYSCPMRLGLKLCGSAVVIVKVLPSDMLMLLMVATFCGGRARKTGKILRQTNCRLSTCHDLNYSFVQTRQSDGNEPCAKLTPTNCFSCAI